MGVNPSWRRPILVTAGRTLRQTGTAVGERDPRPLRTARSPGSVSGHIHLWSSSVGGRTLKLGDGTALVGCKSRPRS